MKSRRYAATFCCTQVGAYRAPGNWQVARGRVKFDNPKPGENGREELASRLSGIKVVITEGGGRARSTARDIGGYRRALANKSFEIDKRKNRPRGRSKNLGEKTVPVKLHPTVIVQLPIRVVAEGKPEAAPAAAKVQAPAEP